MTEAIKAERVGAVGIITLNRPDAGNALDGATAQEFLKAVARHADDVKVRCMLLRANGRIFCAGGDVSAFLRAGDDVGSAIAAVTTPLHSAISLLSRMEKPLVTAVQGAAAGAGLGLALLGDLVFAGHSAKFTAAYSTLGFTPDGAVSWLLPRLVGLRRAQELLLTPRRLTADEALSIGLITRCAADETLQNEALEAATALAAGPVGAFAQTRKLLSFGPVHSLEAHLAIEAESVVAAAQSAEGREGLSAFGEKRQANFLS